MKKKDYMVWDTNGGIAYFYKVEGEKPVVFANWMIGSLGIINCEEEDAINKKINELEYVTEEMANYLDLIQINGKGHIPLEGTLEKPFTCLCDLDDECICGEEE